ncbi:MAG: aldehyde dehydrogenase family protein [Zoogloeaceae bacterium]|jgi:acyl-CoA reductase-like NAD-dependent aldehyde dehydrogenase|nr:aldehyde dehydrogenase family protein [Zoogloeaceae bacterium]
METIEADGPPVLPSWIRGRPCLSLTREFFDVRAADDRVLRRIPLCGGEEVTDALQSAKLALPGWAGLPEEERSGLLSAWGEALREYAGHFAKLLAEESKREVGQTHAEVMNAASALCETPKDAELGGLVCGIHPDEKAPLFSIACLIALTLRAGGVVVAVPCCNAPGATYALLELSGRVGLPGGVANLVQGTEAANAALNEQAVANIFLEEPPVSLRRH